MLWSQFLLSAMMALKKAWVATIFAGLALIPTYTFSLVVKDRFECCYRDAGLLQTSELDGWDNTSETSMQQRETYRRWLVDCHRVSRKKISPRHFSENGLIQNLQVYLFKFADILQRLLMFLFASTEMIIF